MKDPSLGVVSPRIHALFSGLLFALHVITQWGMHYPAVFYDEFLYLGIGRYFAGAGPLPNLHNGAWGHLGYSGVLVPAFWMFRDFRHQYHAVLIINAILMTSTYPLLYLVLKRLAIEPSRWIAPICFVASVYPSFLLFSKFAISENLFTPLFLLTLLLWARFLERPTAGRGVLLGLTCLACYLVHNRGLSVGICVVALSFILVYLKRISWSSAMIVAAIGASSIVLVSGLKRLIEVVWAPATFPTRDISSILTPEGAGLFELVLFGQLIYLVAATFGLFVFGMGYLVNGWRAADDAMRVRRYLILLLVAVHVSVFIGSAAYVSMLDILHRADHVLMGRYNEPLLPVFLAAGLLLVVEAGASVRAKKTLIACAAICAVVAISGALLVTPSIFWAGLRGPSARINILSFMPLHRAFNVDDLGVPLALSCAMAFLIAAGGVLRRPAAAMCALTAVFLVETGFSLTREIRPAQNLSSYDASRGTITRLGPLLAATGIEGTVDVETSVWDSFYFSSWQLQLPDRTFRTFHGPGGAKTAGNLVIAEKDWRSARHGYRNVGCEDDALTCLWIRPPSTP